MASFAVIVVVELSSRTTPCTVSPADIGSTATPTLSLAVDGSLDDMLAGVVQPASAAGDELAGLFDFELSL